MKLRAYIVALHAGLFAVLLGVTPAGSGSMLLMGAGKAGAVSAGLVYTATDAKVTTFGYTTSGSFSGVNFGTASADRIVMIGADTTENSSTLAMTIGGVTATKAIADTVNNTASIWYANVPSGATGTVSWTTTGGINVMAIVVSQIHGQSGGGTATPDHTGAFTGSAMAQPLGPLAVTVTASGVAFVIGSAGNGPAVTPTFTWTGTAATNGDKTISSSAGNTLELGSSHAVSSGNVTVSSTTTMGYTSGDILYAAWAP